MATCCIEGRLAKKNNPMDHGYVERNRKFGFAITAWMIIPAFLAMTVAAMANPIFGKVLMLDCYLIGEARGWVLWFLYAPVLFLSSEKKGELSKGSLMVAIIQLLLLLGEYA